MDYEQKYERALKQAKKELEACGSLDCDAARQIFRLFPELKKSEDEKIRGAILELVKQSNHILNPMKQKSMIAWLEKQGKQNNLLNFDEAEKEKNNFVSGQFIECRKSFNEFKELESYWFEYVGDDTYIGRSDNILNQRFHITPLQLFTLFTHEHCPKEEKQSEQKPIDIKEKAPQIAWETSKHYDPILSKERRDV